jgi:hypothetical protein
MSTIFKFIFSEFGAVDKLRTEQMYTAKYTTRKMSGPTKGEVIREYIKFHEEYAPGRTQRTCK